jgi:hypothetical protein
VAALNGGARQCIPKGSETFIKGKPTAIRHGRVKQITCSNRVSPAGACSQNGRSADRLGVVIEAYLRTNGLWLGGEALIPHFRLPGTPHEIKQRLFASQIVTPPVVVNRDTFIYLIMIERGLNTGRAQFFQHVLFVAPIFYSLKVVMKARADVVMPLTCNDLSPGTGEPYRARKASRSCADDRDRLSQDAPRAETAF